MTIDAGVVAFVDLEKMIPPAGQQTGVARVKLLRGSGNCFQDPFLNDNLALVLSLTGHALGFRPERQAGDTPCQFVHGAMPVFSQASSKLDRDGKGR